MKKIIKKGMAILLAGTMILGTTGTTIKNVSANEESKMKEKCILYKNELAESNQNST